MVNANLNFKVIFRSTDLISLVVKISQSTVQSNR